MADLMSVLSSADGEVVDQNVTLLLASVSPQARISSWNNKLTLVLQCGSSIPLFQIELLLYWKLILNLEVCPDFLDPLNAT